MSKPVFVDLDFQGTSKPINLAAPTGAADAATKAYVDAAIEGLNWKDSVRAASTANINLAAPGTTIDGVTMAANDRFLAKDQTTVPTNGIYIYNGSATPATRAPDASTFAELEGAIIVVEEGTANTGTSWRQTQVNGVIETNNVVLTAFLTGSAAASETVAGVAELATQVETDAGTDDLRIVTPLKLKTSKLFNKTFAAQFGDGSALAFNFDHNMNTRDVIVTVYKNSGNYDDVYVDITRPTVNRVTVTFGAGNTPASNAYRVVIQGTLV
jgi:hypothetical protein